MNKKQRQKVREIAKRFGLTNRQVLEEVAPLVHGDWEGRFARTVDKALDFFEWACKQETKGE